ncbi:ABC transporter permease [Actinobacteria bacterium YIM 96077]|uniref:ABC transporter permease n=1 Tax=Phytoactinopolyspora halophila TaxID=1981511 RepID=A0A329QNW5_9ACTN|nr:ABC transporter permease [Phytoactinopolyspora halophila]AYY14593.1 ABC transporter permease [Actinobacteria bacterium YIM 96077]RAW14030.1 ABC transporter permease [Phytoactinopolyspora halophila]
MNATVHGIQLGFLRGVIELRNSLRTWDEWGNNIFVALAFAVVLYFQRDTILDEATVALATVALPSMLGTMVVLGGVSGTASILAFEREDGTLLRAKAVPHGMVGYLISKIMHSAGLMVVTITVVLVAGLILVPEILSTSTVGWLMAAGILILGLLATLPWGAVIGSLVKSPQMAFGLSALPVGGLAAISGIFYPITALAGWVQAIAQAFPVYWLGHGMRAALVPEAEAAEIGGSWRYVEMLGVLGAWTIVGLLLAPPILRRMARRESGSAVEERRHAAMQRYS